MKKENTAIRLNKLMTDRNLRQVDILKRVEPFCIKYDIKMNKSDLSQYVSGKVEPSQEKLVVLGMALNVSEAWLMGFDVPMDRISAPKENFPQKIIQYYEMLNDTGKKEAEKRIEELTHIPQYSSNVKEHHISGLDKSEHNDTVDELEKEYKKMTSNSVQKKDCTVSSTTDGTEVTQEKASNL